MKSQTFDIGAEVWTKSLRNERNEREIHCAHYAEIFFTLRQQCPDFATPTIFGCLPDATKCNPLLCCQKRHTRRKHTGFDKLKFAILGMTLAALSMWMLQVGQMSQGRGHQNYWFHASRVQDEWTQQTHNLLISQSMSEHLWNETSHLLILIYWPWILAIRRDTQDIQWNLTTGTDAVNVCNDIFFISTLKSANSGNTAFGQNPRFGFCLEAEFAN